LFIPYYQNVWNTVIEIIVYSVLTPWNRLYTESIQRIYREYTERVLSLEVQVRGPGPRFKRGPRSRFVTEVRVRGPCTDLSDPDLLSSSYDQINDNFFKDIHIYVPSLTYLLLCTTVPYQTQHCIHVKIAPIEGLCIDNDLWHVFMRSQIQVLWCDYNQSPTSHPLNGIPESI